MAGDAEAAEQDEHLNALADHEKHHTVLEDEEQRSSSSSTTGNSTSTYAYDHEPYETFQHKIVKLAQSIVQCKNVTLQRHRGGSFNRVVIIRLTHKHAQAKGVFRILRVIRHLFHKDERVRGIFRIPRLSTLSDELDAKGRPIASDEEVQDQAAVLQFLASTDVPAPTLLAFDASAANVIRAPYIFQTCSKGVALDTVYENLAFADKLRIVDDLVHFLLSAERIRFSQCGTLVAGDRADTAYTGSYLFGSDGPGLRVAVRGLAAASSAPPASSLADLLAQMLDNKAAEIRSPPGSLARHIWQQLCAILPEIRTQHIFDLKNETSVSLDRSILYHWDLEPRNILVKQSNTHGDWNIDMVIDWDSVLVVPAVLARKPHDWLWDFESDEGNPSIRSDYDGDADVLSPDRYTNDSGRLSTEDRQIKERYESSLIRGLAQIHPGYDRETYLEETYGKGRWIRRIARFAMHGVHGDNDLKRYEYLMSDWTAYIDEKGIETSLERE